MGRTIYYEDLEAFHIKEPFAPFSATAERDYAAQFRGLADLVTDRIEPLLDPEYRRAEGEQEPGAESGAHRFV